MADSTNQNTKQDQHKEAAAALHATRASHAKLTELIKNMYGEKSQVYTSLSRASTELAKAQARLMYQYATENLAANGKTPYSG